MVFLAIFISLQSSLISGELQTYGTFEKNKCISLIQICGNCTFVNITSIVYPNSTIKTNQIAMTKTGTYYNYTFCETNLTGTYIVNGFGDENGINTIWNYEFYITYQGKTMSTGQAILISFLLVFMVVFLFWTLFGGIFIPYSNNYDAGKLLSINDLKYLKIFLLGVSYFLIWAISGILLSVTYNYLNMDGISSIFKLVFNLLGMMLPIVIIVVISTILINLFSDKKLAKTLNRTFSLKYR
jgi:hypothetical protein